MKYFGLLLTLSLFTFKLSGASFSESKISPWGCDCDLVDNSQHFCQKSELEYLKDEKRKSKKYTHSVGQKSCRAMIRFFQRYISPIDGPRSSFYPTSSQYALEAIQKYGVFRGIALGCDRLMRENSDMWVYPLIEKHGVLRKHDPIH